MESNKTKSKRIMKNTLTLYVRSLLLLAVNLYTSRVILKALGVEDFGIYNVVGGFVSMFTIMTRSLSGACSRFFNVTMGKGDQEKLRMVFSTSLTIQFCLAILVVIICEPIGIWYIANKMVLPSDRVFAAQIVMQFSLITFASKLLTVPYNAAIIAHEKMKAFAYVSIFEGIGTLIISFLVMISPIDTLIFYSCMLCLLQFVIRAIYRIYSRKHFDECKHYIGYDKSIVKEIFGFSMWTFFGQSSNVIRSQGNNLILNLFFGPTVNAARAVSNQVNHAVTRFTGNFMMAMRPQIAQSYASGDHAYMFKLIYRGARYSYYLILLLSVPVVINIDYMLELWLDKVPDHSALFAQLTIFYTMVESLSNPLITANNAYGNIRNYQLTVSAILLMNVPISYLFIRNGCIPETTIIVALILSIICLLVRVILLKNQIGLLPWDFTKKVLFNVTTVTIASYFIPIVFKHFCTISLFTLLPSIILCLVSTSLSIYYLGCNTEERNFIVEKAIRLKRKKILRK